MYTSATDNRPARPANTSDGRASGPVSQRGGRLPLLKTAGLYFAATAFTFLFDKVYGLFAHGVASAHMRLLFLYPLVGGVLAFLLLALLAPGVTARRLWRPAFNLYNSGVACLCCGSLLQGIFQIASTSSPYTALFFITGGALCAAALLCLLAPRRRR